MRLVVDETFDIGATQFLPLLIVFSMAVDPLIHTNRPDCNPYRGSTSRVRGTVTQRASPRRESTWSGPLQVRFPLSGQRRIE